MPRNDDDIVLAIEPVKHGRVTQLVLTGELDMSCADELVEAIREHAEPGRALLLDLRGLQFMDSTGLGTIIRAHGDATRDGWDLAIACDDGPVGRLFDLTDTRDLMRFVDGPEDLDG